MMTVGCSSIEEAQLMGPVPIKLTASVGVEAVTRGADGKIIETDATITRGIQENALATDETVYVWANEQGGSTWDYLKAWTLTNASTGLTGSTQYYPADGTSITMNAVHGNFAETLTEGTTAISSLTHSVLADQNAEKGYEKSDLLFGSVIGSKASTSAPNIAFAHKLSKIEVNLSAGYGYTSDDLTTAQVHLNNVKPSVTVNPADGTIGAATGTAVTITTRKTASGTFEAVIPPQTFDNPDALIAVTTTKDNLTLTSTVPNDVATYASDTRYVYNIRVHEINKRLNPLWYVAENNVQSYNRITKVVTLETDPTSTGSSYCYTWGDAMAYFSKQGATSYDEYWAGDITDGSSTFYYHLPSRKEWLSVVSSDEFWPIDDSETSTSNEGGFKGSPQTCIFGYNAETKAGISDKAYWSTYTRGTYVRYAIRFLGTPHCSIWKYDTTGSYVTITAKLIDYLAADADEATLSFVLNYYMAKSDSWWNSNDENEGAIQRKFYKVGYRNSSNSSGVANADTDRRGLYYSTTEITSGISHFHFTLGGLLMHYTDSKWGLSVRLFRNTGDSGERVSDPGISLTSSTIGMIVASNGKAYTLANYNSAYGAKIAMVGYKNGNSGQAIALYNSAVQSWNAITSNGSKANQNVTLASGYIGDYLTAAPSGTTWYIFNKGSYSSLFYSMGSTTTSSSSYTPDANVNNKINSVGGWALTSSGTWCTTQYDSSNGYYFGPTIWSGSTKTSVATIRPVLVW